MEKRRAKNPAEGKNYAAYTHLTVKEPCQLLDFLMKAKDGASRTKVKGVLSGGGVLVNGQVETRYDFPLLEGMKVDISRRKNQDTKRTQKAAYMKIVHEDRFLIVVEKMPGILSMSTPHHQFSIKSLLDEHLKNNHQKCTAHVVHRLDRDTSGLMVYAKSMDCRNRFEQDWHTTVYDRRYVAVVSGEMNHPNGTVSSWLKDDRDYFTHSYKEDVGGCKFAVTHYRTLHKSPQGSLVELRLETGRKNQIRVHMADLGHPVAGDTKYGDGFNPIDRLCLHAYRLCFIHPYTGEKMEFETAIPADFRLQVEGR